MTTCTKTNQRSTSTQQRNKTKQGKENTTQDKTKQSKQKARLQINIGIKTTNPGGSRSSSS